MSTNALILSRDNGSRVWQIQLVDCFVTIMLMACKDLEIDAVSFNDIYVYGNKYTGLQ